MEASELAVKTGIPREVIIEKIGLKRKPVAAPHETPAFMAAAAARKALEMAGMKPEELDCVIYNGGQHKDYMCWLAGLKITDELGAVNAWSFDMEAMCGSMISGLEVARGLIASGRCTTVLLASGYRNGDLVSYGVPETTFMFDLGAGGSAVILQGRIRRQYSAWSVFQGATVPFRSCVQ